MVVDWIEIKSYSSIPIFWVRLLSGLLFESVCRLTLLLLLSIHPLMVNCGGGLLGKRAAFCFAALTSNSISSSTFASSSSASSTFSGLNSLRTRFDPDEAHLVSRCAFAAQQKERRQRADTAAGIATSQRFDRSTMRRSRSTSDFTIGKSSRGVALDSFDANAPFLNGLPVNQAMWVWFFFLIKFI